MFEPCHFSIERVLFVSMSCKKTFHFNPPKINNRKRMVKKQPVRPCKQSYRLYI